MSTWLVTPGTARHRFTASMNFGADVALLDLEDSVPLTGKNTARTAVLNFLAEGRGAFPGRPTTLGVRMNAPGTKHGLRDLLGLVEPGRCPAVLVVPKVEAARDVELVAQITGATTEHCQIWALIETPRAVQRLPSILSSPGLAGVLFGAADYAAAAGCRLTGRALSYPRAALTAGAAAAGLPAIDSPFFDLHDLDGLRKEAEDAVELGFFGKVAVHPRQLPVIRSVFQPSVDELEAAHAIVRAAEAAGGAITTVNGRMVGPPLVAVARALTTRTGAAPVPMPSEEDHYE
ncbi:HpcH/HpaI aldolase/citrate lyase family protein [Streptomyces hygroscopicus]|uniref:HpcH/HpaI aldolase/citrate lyase family protein n=1 Tax=Streptomyces hygroscopicus TaxID=1912 RepID=UPI001FCAE886|nr:CoA ester lyase [Streptomyces hygroscopicus]